MLVLTRKRNEVVVVGPCQFLKHALKVTVLDIKNKSVKLGFEAEKECLIHRWEVWQQIDDNVPTEAMQKMTSSR